MKRQTLILVTVSFALSACLTTAQQKGADSPEMEYLRRLIAEQQKNPDKIIRVVPKTNASAAATTTTNRPATAPETAKTATPKNAAPVRARENTNAAPLNAEAAQQKKISEVETRLDEMIKQKEAREKAAVNNTAPATNAASAAPLTKRQRLDALLKEMIDGKISGAEYNERRAKIIAEPD